MDGIATTMVMHIQISDYDVYRAQPSRLDQFQTASVPIIRIYGALRVPHTRDLAYNVVVHVHNCYPYVYIECTTKTYSDAHLQSVKDRLEQLLSASFHQADSDSDHESDDDSPILRFVAAVEYCRGVPMYGYHIGYRVVLKVLLLLPRYKTRLVRLLAEGKIDLGLNHLGVYEAHINYFSQFLADYNLYGCGWLELSACQFRFPVAIHTGVSLDPLKTYLATYVAHNNVLSSSRFPRMGRSTLEIDISVADILNRSRLHESHIHSDFSAFNGKAPKHEIYLSSLQLTFDDLKYQCTLRNNLEASQLLHELYRQVFRNIGKGGFCEWENLAHLNSLLPYVEKLNHARGIDDPDQYYAKVVAPGLSGDSFPTCFSIIDATSSLKHYEEVPLLNFRDDLVRWDSYELLFETAATTSHIESGLHADEDFLDNNNDNADDNNYNNYDNDKSDNVDNDNSDNVDNNDSDNVYDNKSDIDGDDKNDSDIDSAPINTSDASNTNSESEPKYIDESAIQGLDSHLLLMSQRKPQTQSSPISDSISWLLSQTLHSLLRNPQSIWEYVIPTTLHKKRIKLTMEGEGILNIVYSDPSYSKKSDVHAQPLVFASRKIAVPYNNDDNLPNVVICNSELLLPNDDESNVQDGDIQTWQYLIVPPSKQAIKLKAKELQYFHERKRVKFKSQIEPAVTETNNYKYSYRPQKIERDQSGFLNMTLLNMEVHVNTTSSLRPNPKNDPVCMIILHFDNANRMHGNGESITTLLICTENFTNPNYTERQLQLIAHQIGVEIFRFNSERELVYGFVRKVNEYDPDILSGYEVNASSWGYLIERFEVKYNERLMPQFSRSMSFANGKFGDRWGYTHTSAIKINGRHMLNIWRLLKNELSLTSYTLENVCFHTLHRTLPRFLNLTLSKWIQGGIFAELLMFCTYFKNKVDTTMQIIATQEFVLRSIEKSRIIGVDFYSNFYRGSQFKVESILLRIAKMENLLVNSPSKMQVHHMRALDVIPLIMEPDSNFYKSPLAVLDFQSLYPSIMIAYNYCYSTLLGKVEGFNQKSNEVGYLKNLPLPPGIIEVLRKNDGLNISPNGYMFVSAKFRKSILAKMLEEILNMRINMRSVASAFPDDRELSRLLNSKQLAMKLIANVTYGYTLATFSGRMPNSDIADAIVATGRELMAKSIQMVESSDFGAKVVYGDTDSLFVYFPGKSKDDAFKYANELAQTITDALPDPIKLKFEKIYHPCVLLAKKRYVGQCYESKDQKVPSFEAKGIETIRRDGVPAQLKMVGKTLRILFETKDLSKVKEYVIRQFFKIRNNRINVKDFCFARAVRYGTYKNEQHLPPGAIVARNRMKKDPRSEPQYKERVPYLVIKDVTKERVKDRCFSPEEYIASYATASPMELDYEYYITRVLIPPLERVFNLMGVKIKEWYREMLRDTKQLAVKREDILRNANVQVGECFHCHRKLNGSSNYLCTECIANGVDLIVDILLTLKEKQKQVLLFRGKCRVCNYEQFGNSACGDLGFHCCNEDCETYYACFKATTECEHLALQTRTVLGDVNKLQW